MFINGNKNTSINIRILRFLQKTDFAKFYSSYSENSLLIFNASTVMHLRHVVCYQIHLVADPIDRRNVRASTFLHE